MPDRPDQSDAQRASAPTFFLREPDTDRRDFWKDAVSVRGAVSVAIFKIAEFGRIPLARV